MALFFLSVGLELRLEAHEGVLAEERRAALPAAAALVLKAFAAALSDGD